MSEMIDKRSFIPLYEQLLSIICNRITNGVYLIHSSS
jgi:DNA-binding GntR family transcriptional regulator